jgi:hypothetical protein
MTPPVYAHVHPDGRCELDLERWLGIEGHA